MFSNLIGQIVVLFPLCCLNASLSPFVLSGGEGDGLSPGLRQLCDILLTIPPHRHLHPGVESLNVSVATGMCSLGKYCSELLVFTEHLPIRNLTGPQFRTTLYI